MKLGKLSTLSECAKYLSAKTGYAWTEAILLQVAALESYPLLAEPNKPAPVEVNLFESDRSLKPILSRKVPWKLALLSSTGIEELLEIGMTYVHDAIGHYDLVYTRLPDELNPLGLVEELPYRQTCQFSPEIVVTLEMVRIPELLIDDIVAGKIAFPSNIPPSSNTATTGKKLVLKQQLQEEEIINWLINNGFTPHELPKGKPGKPGVKSKVRQALQSNHQLFSGKTFNKAWERLLANHLINYM